VSLTLPELAAVAASLRPRLLGGQVQRIRQPDDEHVVLTIRGRAAQPAPGGGEEPAPGAGATWELLLGVRPRLARVHLTWRAFEVPPSPPAFTQRLRKLLMDGRVRDVSLPWPDRVLVLELAHGAESWRLLIEITGHHGNAFLLDAAGTILTTLRPTASRRRDLRPGQPYVPPLPPDRPAPVAADGGDGAGGGQSGHGAHGGDAGAAGPPFAPAPPAALPTGEALHRALDARYAALDREIAWSARTGALRRRLRAALGRAERRAERIAADLARARETNELRARGELLAASLHLVQKGMTAVEVPDWSRPDGGTVVVPLRPDLSPQENLSALFAGYRKGRRAAPLASGRREDAAAEAAALRDLLARLDALPPPDAAAEAEADAAPALADIEAAAAARGVAAGPRHVPHGRKKAGQGRRLPYKRYSARDGTPLLVGRGGADNGTLTFRVARDNDPWLHVRDGAGAHVVVRRDKGRPVERETLLDAATLAAHFSKRRGEDRVEVHVTPRRHVRPLKDAPPGTVRVERSETIVAAADPARLARLLATLEGDPDGA
jgi:predicted ribosome quality control (RQC) complex YloA/Tae2 family protein